MRKVEMVQGMGRVGSPSVGERRTIEFTQNAIHGSRAAAAGHADVEFVGVFC